MLPVADIYCGAGGLSSGFADARFTDDQGDIHGIDVVFGVDRDPDCMATFRRNHYPDLERASRQLEARAPCRSVVGLSGQSILDGLGLDRIPVVIGGPNCQGVSTVGLRNPDDKRNEMFREFCRLLHELEPDWFVMENVPGLVQSNNLELLETILETFEDTLGYDVAADVLLAADFGVAQLRYRLFVIGNKIGRPIRFPYVQFGRPVRQGELGEPATVHPHRTVRDAIGFLEELPPSVSTDGRDGIRHGEMLPNHVVSATQALNVRRIQWVPPGYDWRMVPIGLQPTRNLATRVSDQVGTYGRLRWDMPAYTVTATAANVTAGMFTHPSQDRPISAREAAILQGFDRDYEFLGPTSSVYKQVGNAVPPPLARAVAETLLACHLSPGNADAWGRVGRITLDALRARRGPRPFPVLTPRHAYVQRPKPTAPVAPRPLAKASKVQQSHFESDPSRRVPIPTNQLDALRSEAAQPGNVKAGRRARTILAYFQGAEMEELESLASASKGSIQRWIEGFYREGVEGWRVYHTPVSRLAGDDPEVLTRLEIAVERVRARGRDESVESDTNGHHPGEAGAAKDSRRDFENPYLRSLIERYSGYTVWDLVDAAQSRLSGGVGTVYLGDLLAICDALDVPPLEIDGRTPDWRSATGNVVEAEDDTAKEGSPEGQLLVVNG